VSGNVIPREQVRAGVVECPLCGRQVAAPTDHLLVYSSVERVAADTADAIECPACGGVTFIVDDPDGSA
jgi:ribosomal protein S27E